MKNDGHWLHKSYRYAANIKATRHQCAIWARRYLHKVDAKLCLLFKVPICYFLKMGANDNKQDSSKPPASVWVTNRNRQPNNHRDWNSNDISAFYSAGCNLNAQHAHKSIYSLCNRGMFFCHLASLLPLGWCINYFFASDTLMRPKMKWIKSN